MKQLLGLLLFLLAIQVTFGQNANELNKQSKTLIEQGKYKKALSILEKAAKLGNAEAQYNLGFLLQSGGGGEKQPKEAIKWLKKSAQSKFNDAYYALMMAYGNGVGVEQNSGIAFSYAMKCAQNNDPTCMWNVVNCYISGNGVKQDTSQFKIWLIRLAKLPNPENLVQSGYITSARLQLAHFYRDGKYFTKDLYKSYLWYLIYNESKVDFSILQQNKATEEIEELEKHLDKKEIKSAPIDAEKLLGRKLTKIADLHQDTL